MRFDTVEEAAIAVKMYAKTFKERRDAAVWAWLVEELGDLARIPVNRRGPEMYELLAKTSQAVTYAVACRWLKGINPNLLAACNRVYEEQMDRAENVSNDE